jgi:hypothetical protein
MFRVKLPRESTDSTVSRVWNCGIVRSFSLSAISLSAISSSSACGSDGMFERTALLIDYEIHELVTYFVKLVRKGESNDRILLTCCVRGHGIKVDFYFGSSQE